MKEEKGEQIGVCQHVVNSSDWLLMTFQFPLPPSTQTHVIYPFFLLLPQVENNFHIPRATQNWIIGPKLVKNTTDLQRTLKDYEITATAGKAKVYLYVMHVKKANVPKEEYDYIRQRQKDTMSQQQMQQPAAMGHQDMGHQGMGHQDMGHQDMGHQGMGHQGMGQGQVHMGQVPGHMEAPMPMHQSQPPGNVNIYVSHSDTNFNGLGIKYLVDMVGMH